MGGGNGKGWKIGKRERKERREWKGRRKGGGRGINPFEVSENDWGERNCVIHRKERVGWKIGKRERKK